MFRFDIFNLHPSRWHSEMPYKNGFFFYPGPFPRDHAQGLDHQIPRKYYSRFSGGVEHGWHQLSRSRSVPSLGESRWRKKASKLILAEFTEHYGYEDKITNTKSDVKIPTLQDLMEWAAQRDKLKLVLLKLKIPANESHLAPIMLKKNKADYWQHLSIPKISAHIVNAA